LKKKSLKTLFLASAENNAKKHMYKRIEGKKSSSQTKYSKKQSQNKDNPPPSKQQDGGGDG